MTEPGRASESGDTSLSRTYTLVFLVETLVIAGLYWIGRHFG